MDPLERRRGSDRYARLQEWIDRVLPREEGLRHEHGLARAIFRRCRVGQSGAGSRGGSTPTGTTPVGSPRARGREGAEGVARELSRQRSPRGSRRGRQHFRAGPRQRWRRLGPSATPRRAAGDGAGPAFQDGA